jgi:hypothetical protein
MKDRYSSAAFYIQRSRKAGSFCYNVRPLLENCVLPCLPLGIKVLLKEDGRLLAFGFLDVGGFWKGGLLEKDS